MTKKKANPPPDTGEARRSVRLDLSKAAYDAAKEAAQRDGIRCVGSKIRIDMERYYANVAHRQERRLARALEGGS